MGQSIRRSKGCKNISSSARYRGTHARDNKYESPKAETPNWKRGTMTKSSPGTYSNAVKSVVLCRQVLSALDNRVQNTTLQRGKERADSDYNERNFNRTKFPEFQRTSERENMFLIGSSTLKRMSPRKLSTEKDYNKSENYLRGMN